MRILYSHRTRSADGQAVHIQGLTEALAARGHTVLVSAPRVEAAQALAARRPADTWRRLVPRPFTEIAELSYSVPAYLRLESAARSIAPDILYERYNLFYHSGAQLARARRLPFLLEVNAPLSEERAQHGGLALKHLARRSETALWRAADAVLAVTAVLARKIEQAGVPPERVHAAPNGVDPAFLMPADPRSVRERHALAEKVVLGFAGFLREWHRVDAVIDYLRQTARDDLHLLIVGDGPARSALEAQIAAQGLRARVTFAGVVPRAEMPAHLAAFDIALQPAAVPYASPLKLYEYMAMGLPIVAPDQENIREALSGEDAALFSPEDPAAFRSSLDALVSDPSLRAKLGFAARATLLRREFTWDAAARRVEAVAGKLLEKRR